MNPILVLIVGYAFGRLDRRVSKLEAAVWGDPSPAPQPEPPKGRTGVVNGRVKRIIRHHVG